METIEYNYFADATYVLLKRKIKGEGSYRGIFNLEIAVNPWSQRDQTDGEVVFLKPKRGVVSSRILVKDPDRVRKALLGEGQKKFLFLKNINIQLTEEGSDSKSLNKFSLWLRQGDLYVKALNIKGDNKSIPIKNGGHFRVFSRILQYNRDNKDNKKLDSLDKVSDAEAPSVVLNSQGLIEHSLARQTTPDKHIRLQIHKELSKNWDEERGWVALRIQPLNFPFGDFFRQFNSIYDVGLLTSFHRAGKAQERPLESEKYSRLTDGWSQFDRIFASERIQNGQFIDSSMMASLDKSQRHSFAKYDFTDMRPNFEKIKRGESVTTRQIIFRTQTCLTRKSDGTSPRLGSKFQISVKDLQNPKRDKVYNLEIQGKNRCLNFVHEFWYKHFKPERYFYFNLEVKEMAPNTVADVLGISINPWDEGWTFGRDRIHVSDASVQDDMEAKKIQSRFWLPNFSYFTLRFRYAIDKFLKIKVKKSILLYLKPSMLRYSSLKMGRTGIYKLRDGIYLMKAALEKHYLDPSTDAIIKPSNKLVGGGEHRKSHQFILKSELRTRHHISIVKRLVRVIDGQIIAPVEFTVADLRIMRIRAQMMVQLQPVEEWRHYMVKLYNDFYQRRVEKLREENMLLKWETFESLHKEKIANMKKIIASMSENERMVHHFVEYKYKNEAKRNIR